MRTLALIPAKGTSARVPGKNLRLLGGKPLVQWTIEAALGAGLDRVVVSTEDAAIAAVAEHVGAEVLHRPQALATNDATTHDVLAHAVETLGDPADVLVLLYPTSPFRTAEHITEALALYTDQPVPRHPVVSVGRPLPAHLVCRGQPGVPLLRSTAPTMVANGAIWIIDRALFGAVREIPIGGSLPYAMDPLDGLDIDYPQDFAVAEWWAATRGAA